MKRIGRYACGRVDFGHNHSQANKHLHNEHQMLQKILYMCCYRFVHKTSIFHLLDCSRELNVLNINLSSFILRIYSKKWCVCSGSATTKSWGDGATFLVSSNKKHRIFCIFGGGFSPLSKKLGGGYVPPVPPFYGAPAADTQNIMTQREWLLRWAEKSIDQTIKVAKTVLFQQRFNPFFLIFEITFFDIWNGLDVW